MSLAQHGEKIWSQVLEVVRGQVTTAQFDTWFARTRCTAIDGSKVAVEVPNTFYLEWLKRQYGGTLENALRVVTGDESSALHFVALNTGGPQTPAPRSDDTPRAHLQPAAGTYSAMPEFARECELNLNSEYSFDSYVVGSSNRLAHAAALAVAEGTGRAYNPLFIHGGLGLGKTHLLQAICQALTAKRPGLRFLYLPCEQFINRFITALEKGQVDAFRQRYRMLDVLVIDDIHFLANKEHTQEEFFHTFNALYNDRKQIILSSDSAPKEIPNIEERLVSRFKWGLVCEIEAPTFETRLAILRKKAARLGLVLPDEVAEHLAAGMKSSIRELEGAINNLAGFASVMKRAITIDVAKEVLGESLGVKKKRTTLDRIVSLVIDHYGVRLSDLQSKKRFQSIAVPRQVCMYLARKYTNHSLAEIGGSFGGRDHSTVLYAAEKIAKSLETDGELRTVIQDLSRSLEA